MPKFRVTLRRTVTYETATVVEAPYASLAGSIVTARVDVDTLNWVSGNDGFIEVDETVQVSNDTPLSPRKIS